MSFLVVPSLQLIFIAVASILVSKFALHAWIIDRVNPNVSVRLVRWNAIAIIQGYSFSLIRSSLLTLRPKLFLLRCLFIYLSWLNCFFLDKLICWQLVLLFGTSSIRRRVVILWLPLLQI